jgi:hypothetical protein
MKEYYKAGSCLPLLLPKGCLGQCAPVRLEMVEALEPQNLQLYFDFSDPSYKACRPLFEPSGCLGQCEPVNEEIEEAVIPQYRHWNFDIRF